MTVFLEGDFIKNETKKRRMNFHAAFSFFSKIKIPPEARLLLFLFLA